ncbi:hypothetical protein FHS42_006431 [Streptomyces zagrosensis]|uniref:Uncharacterized protein n=1 Tax=Streptomyces zagrosensis TaxID=1042984 RepID=A0A7W9QFK3_9ACTN|nr:hypothetical protein [Streptomyces zagrosensis]
MISNREVSQRHGFPELLGLLPRLAKAADAHLG